MATLRPSYELKLPLCKKKSLIRWRQQPRAFCIRMQEDIL
jgi:hypothetical protein